MHTLLLRATLTFAQAQPPVRAVPPSSAAGHASSKISTSVGQQGGVIVLWPRIIPATQDPTILSTARSVQARLTALARERYPTRAIDVRPEPQRACPQAGCEATSVNAVIVHNQGSCVVVGLVAPPGRSPTTMIPWAGPVDLKQPTVPFRDYPESSLVIRDFLGCDDLAAPLAAQQEPIAEAIRLHSTP